MNRQVFFNYVRNAPFGGRITTSQMNGLNAILDYWQKSGLVDIRWLAYMLATAFWETAKTMQPIREANGKSDAATMAALDKAYAAGKLTWVSKPYWKQGFFGRGLVQLTHRDNYAKMGNILGIPLEKNPSLALDMQVALAIMFEGMIRGVSSKGDFTGKSLEDYFNMTVDDPVNARRIINGKDKAELIAGFYRSFLAAINAAIEAEDDGQAPEHVTPEAAEPDDVPVSKSKSIWAILAAIFTGGGAGAVKAITENGTAVLQSIDNPWAALSLLSLVGGGILVWMLATGRLQQLRSKAIK